MNIDITGKSAQWIIDNVWGGKDRAALKTRLDYIIGKREEWERRENTDYKDYNMVEEKELIYLLLGQW